MVAEGIEFYRKKLDNGLTVLFERRSLPVVCSSISVRLGAEFESEALKGASHFIEHLVFKGTKKRTQEEISREIEKKGGALNAFTSEEVTCYWDKLPFNYLNLGIDIISDITLNPLFNEVELEKERKVILEEIKMYRDNPQFYVLKKIKSLLYKPPFGLDISGDEKTVSNMSRESILRWYENYSTSNMILTVVGNADFEEICSIAEKNFPKRKTEISEIIPVRAHGEIIEKRKGLDQANLVLGYHIPTLQDKDRYSAEVVNAILAGGMSSRLFQELREKRGLVYAIKGMAEQDKNYGYEMIYAGTTKENVEKVKLLILKEIKKLEKIEKAELEEAKEQLIGLNKLERENSEDVMVDLISEENAGNAGDFYNYEKRISAVDLEQVRRLAKLKNYSFVALVPE